MQRMSPIRKSQAKDFPQPARPQLGVHVPPDSVPEAHHRIWEDLSLGLMVVSCVLFAAACVIYGLYPASKTLLGL
jgi:hypothetical protein